MNYSVVADNITCVCQHDCPSAGSGGVTWSANDIATVVIALLAFVISEVLGLVNHDDKYRSVLQVIAGVVGGGLKVLMGRSGEPLALAAGAAAVADLEASEHTPVVTAHV